MTSDIRDPLWAMIKGCSFVSLITLEQSGCLRAWPVASSQQEYDGNLWFFVSNDSPAIANVECDPQVCLVYTQVAQADVVSVSGSALVVTNIAQKQQLWNPVAQAWFPQGPTAGSLVLLRVAVERAEYWDARSNRLVRFSTKSKTWNTDPDRAYGSGQRLLTI